MVADHPSLAALSTKSGRRADVHGLRLAVDASATFSKKSTFVTQLPERKGIRRDVQ
jgi:hypothetical protein